MDTNTCLNCEHWEGKREIDTETPLQPFDKEWRDGACYRIKALLDVDVNAGWEGGYVDRIKTPASFGCVAFKSVETADI